LKSWAVRFRTRLVIVAIGDASKDFHAVRGRYNAAP
jgi:hypothetical protein